MMNGWVLATVLVAGYLASGLLAVPVAVRVFPLISDGELVATKGVANAWFWFGPFTLFFAVLVLLAVMGEKTLVPLGHWIVGIPLAVARVSARDTVKVEGRDTLPPKRLPDTPRNRYDRGY